MRKAYSKLYTDTDLDLTCTRVQMLKSIVKLIMCEAHMHAGENIRTFVKGVKMK